MGRFWWPKKKEFSGLFLYPAPFKNIAYLGRSFLKCVNFSQNSVLGIQLWHILHFCVDTYVGQGCFLSQLNLMLC